jgi:hypothetical protein
MATEAKSFADLVKAAPAAPATGTISLVGTLAQSSEAGNFVLTLQDGSSVTLETAAVKGYAVLGASVGQTIVRVDVDAGKIPTIRPPDNTSPLPWVRTAGGVAPFSLATPHQVPVGGLAAVQGFGLYPTMHTLDLTQPGYDTHPIQDGGLTGHFPHPD